MIESEFNPTAKSPVKATGLWQFMAATARQYGLTVRGSTDERNDPARSTDAALKYLSKLHDRFGSWYLAAAAYNAGEGTVSRALNRELGKSQGTDEDFFRIIHALPKETQNYVPKLIATTHVAADPAAFGLVVPDRPVMIAKKAVKPAARKAVASKPAAKKTSVATKSTAAKKATVATKPAAKKKTTSRAG
jgi:membrane-bound lytic murein transglycosylase D